MRHGSTRVVTGSARVAWWLIAVVWVGVTSSFWTWWLQQASGGTPWLFWPQTVALLYYTTLLPSFFLYFVYRMRRPRDVALFPFANTVITPPSHQSIRVQEISSRRGRRT